MKTILLTSILILGYFNINAQQSHLAFLHPNDVENTLAIKSKTTNSINTYFKNVASNSNSKIVKALQNEILNFDLRTNSIYAKSEKSTYFVMFEKNQCKAIVVYNDNAIIVSSKETYKNIKMPYVIRAFVIKKYSGWSIDSNKLIIEYTKNKGVKKEYSINIKKGNLKKTIKF